LSLVPAHPDLPHAAKVAAQAWNESYQRGSCRASCSTSMRTSSGTGGRNGALYSQRALVLQSELPLERRHRRGHLPVGRARARAPFGPRARGCRQACLPLSRLDQVSDPGIATRSPEPDIRCGHTFRVEQCRSSMAGSPGHQLADPDHQQWPPHNAQICAAGAERGIDAATAPNGGSSRVRRRGGDHALRPAW
jgi:hypothetical protein